MPFSKCFFSCGLMSKHVTAERLVRLWKVWSLLSKTPTATRNGLVHNNCYSDKVKVISYMFYRSATLDEMLGSALSARQSGHTSREVLTCCKMHSTWKKWLQRVWSAGGPFNVNGHRQIGHTIYYNYWRERVLEGFAFDDEHPLQQVVFSTRLIAVLLRSNSLHSCVLVMLLRLTRTEFAQASLQELLSVFVCCSLLVSLASTSEIIVSKRDVLDHVWFCSFYGNMNGFVDHDGWGWGIMCRYFSHAFGGKSILRVLFLLLILLDVLLILCCNENYKSLFCSGVYRKDRWGSFALPNGITHAMGHPANGAMATSINTCPIFCSAQRDEGGTIREVSVLEL